MITQRQAMMALPPAIGRRNTVLNEVASNIEVPLCMVDAQEWLRDEVPGLGLVSARQVLQAIAWLIMDVEKNTKA